MVKVKQAGGVAVAAAWRSHGRQGDSVASQGVDGSKWVRCRYGGGRAFMLWRDHKNLLFLKWMGVPCTEESEKLIHLSNTCYVHRRKEDLQKYYGSGLV
ncbi:hypothetical protein NPIL_604851 [Nephila pilipes]|uniref:Uncharacterized protein n=1 Tax=Nephila pilipes TaxID=299642 RepID=A0A8X6QTX7_NEPPI|nr:hypothetical protein NPIL_604851 [Nephila pilipes]